MSFLYKVTQVKEVKSISEVNNLLKDERSAWKLLEVVPNAKYPKNIAFILGKFSSSN
ncbi:hypothetical protein [Clostridium sporogenes]|uniref:hypothetical protein n=1 Tax=Clostridium sporogenes TaxID=1509 RepID=UPI000A429760|nr:hypothetical protein [Clostridium sporogenes]